MPKVINHIKGLWDNGVNYSYETPIEADETLLRLATDKVVIDGIVAVTFQEIDEEPQIEVQSTDTYGPVLKEPGMVPKKKRVKK